MRLKNTANGLIAAGMAILCLTSNLTPAFAAGEDDPLWTRNTYEKKVFAIGNKLLNDNNISEVIAFRVNYTSHANG